MNGFIKKQAAALCVIGGLTALAGCPCYRDIVDPCYPARYEAESRNLVISGMAEAEGEYDGLHAIFLRKPCPPENLIHEVQVALGY